MIFSPHTCLTARQVLSFYHSIARAMQFKKVFIWSKNLYSSLPAGRFRFNSKSLNHFCIYSAFSDIEQPGFFIASFGTEH